jgi:hypothetical protein
MRRGLITALLLSVSLIAAGPPPAAAEGPPSLSDRVEELQQEMDSLIEDVDDLVEPVQEFALFDECMYLIGVTQHGTRDGAAGYLYGAGGRRRPALALDIRGFRRPQFQFLAFPAEEPPSIECNEDAGQESVDN